MGILSQRSSPAIDPILRVAKILLTFSGGKVSKKMNREELLSTGIKILREEVCHKKQVVAVNGVAKGHDGAPSPNVVKILTELLALKKDGQEDAQEQLTAKGKGKRTKTS